MARHDDRWQQDREEGPDRASMRLLREVRRRCARSHDFGVAKHVRY